jgi:hypothetical protein
LANTLIVFDSATVEVLFRWQNSLLGQLVGRNYNEGFQRYEMVLADPFFTPDAYLNPKSYPTKIMFSEVTTTTTLSGSAWRINTTLNNCSYSLIISVSSVNNCPSIGILPPS